jgi:hypothetical protein
VAITFRLTLEGTPPDDAVFALQSGTEGGGAAVYLCSYYGGWPACEAGGVYRERVRFAPGAIVHFAFWRELDTDGTQEMLKQGEFVVGVTDRVVGVSYSFETRRDF